MIEVFSTYNPGDIAVIKSVLDGEDIHYYFQGENTNMLVAAGAYARLLVQADQAGRVREILQEMGFLEK
ncbi:MAG: putative signal transducing protein [Smithellaceae bacterium]